MLNWGRRDRHQLAPICFGEMKQTFEWTPVHLLAYVCVPALAVPGLFFVLLADAAIAANLFPGLSVTQKGQRTISQIAAYQDRQDA